MEVEMLPEEEELAEGESPQVNGDVISIGLPDGTRVLLSSTTEDMSTLHGRAEFILDRIAKSNGKKKTPGYT